MSTFAVRFVARDVPLEPIAVAARGTEARALATRALRTPSAEEEEGTLGLRGVANRELVILLGETARLPWVDGAFYLGIDPGAPRLLLPTQMRPTVPPAIFERALLRRSDVVVPVAVLVDTRTVVSVAAARPIERAKLEVWLGASR